MYDAFNKNEKTNQNNKTRKDSNIRHLFDRLVVLIKTKRFIKEDGSIAVIKLESTIFRVEVYLSFLRFILRGRKNPEKHSEREFSIISLSLSLLLESTFSPRCLIFLYIPLSTVCASLMTVVLFF